MWGSDDKSKDVTEDRLSRIIFFCFAAFLFFLPLYEAPKNIFSVLFVLLGGWDAFRRKKAADQFKRKDLVAWAFLLLAISPFVAGLNSPFMDLPSLLSSALNWALMPLVGLVMILVKFSKTLLLWALRSFCLGSVVAVGEAFFSWSGSPGTFPELNSVGHVNQSALYLAFSLIPAILLLILRESTFDLFLGLSVIVACFAFQAPALSLVGFSVCLALMGCMCIIYCWNRSYLKTLVGFLVLGFSALSFLVTQPPEVLGPYGALKSELLSRLSSTTDPFSQRDRLVNTAIEVAGDSLLGFGIGSFGVATQAPEIRKRVESNGKDWAVERGNYFSANHGHNIFANLLVERGWVGVFSIGTFLFYLLIRFGGSIRVEDSQIGLVVVVAICVAGLGQSTLHVEHGQLAFICLVLCLLFPEASSEPEFRR